VKPVKVTVAVPVFVTVTLNAALVIPTVCELNVKLVGATLTVAPVDVLNVEVTVVAAVKVTTQVPVPVQPPPLQPANVEPVPATAVSVTIAPLAKLAEHPSGQLMPAGALVTVPVPVPASLTVRVKLLVLALKFAVTAVAAVIVNVHVPVPSQVAPPHPVNVDPSAGIAVNVICVPLGKLAVQVVGQLIAPEPSVTVPLPVPASVTVSVSLTFVSWHSNEASAGFVSTVEVNISTLHGEAT
jgi:hypothetical protein